ncbi:MAG: stage 0 sporulation family protein [Clostridiales bacterium]|nr:stage 0 sporulation family protein [Clostridiales bacterium]
MPRVIGVRFRNAGKLYYFDPGAHWPPAGHAVIVETQRGMEYAEVVVSPQDMPQEKLEEPLYSVLRIATQEDAAQNTLNRSREAEARSICQKRIQAHKLDMKLVSVEYTFDGSKLIAYFTANGRVDFRALVKDLAGVFHTRIELRQIGVRDEARMLGGLGPCGRPICCAQFLGDFHPVSVKMAKEQNLSLNPTKISGGCGRLMCCLKYEQDQYEKTRKRMPRVGKDVVTPDGRALVTDINVLKETVKVRLPKGDGYEFKEYHAADVQRLTPEQPVRAKNTAPQGKPTREAAPETDADIDTEDTTADITEE